MVEGLAPSELPMNVRYLLIASVWAGSLSFTSVSASLSDDDDEDDGWGAFSFFLCLG